jgi:hypothetical protein
MAKMKTAAFVFLEWRPNRSSATIAREFAAPAEY